MKHLLPGVLLLHLAWATASLAAPSPSVQVSGDISKPRAWTLAQLQKVAPTETITTTLKGKPYTARGVRLWSLIQAAILKTDPKEKHPEARFVVLARGDDGYLASFALPELLPDAGNKGAFLVWEQNGKPLPAKEGPFRLVVPGETKPMRWVYNLVGVEIYDGKRLSQMSPSSKASRKP